MSGLLKEKSSGVPVIFVWLIYWSFHPTKKKLQNLNYTFYFFKISKDSGTVEANLF